LAILVLPLFIMSTSAQDMRLPYLTCGNGVRPAYPSVIVKVRPLSPVDSLRVPLRVEDLVQGYNHYPVWEFEVLDRYEGYCQDTLRMAVDEGNESLLEMRELKLKFGKMDGALFAMLSTLKNEPIDCSKHVRTVHGGPRSIMGKVIKVERQEAEFSLADLGITLALPDSANYGYDTAMIEDVTFKITFEMKQGTFVAFTRDSLAGGHTLFQVGESYLMRLLPYNNENWILNDHLYKKGYHIDAYFEAYESIR